MIYTVTFSVPYIGDLGNNWKKTYDSMADAIVAAEQFCTGMRRTAIVRDEQGEQVWPRKDGE